MPVDTSAVVKASIDKVLARARACESEDKRVEAASAYLQAAGLMRRHAEMSRVSAVRKQRLASARQYEQLASKLKSSKYVKSVVDAVPQTTVEPVETEQHESEIESLIEKSKVTWDEIGGLEETKREIKAAYGLSLAKAPRGVRLSGWKTILFYGPPGTGKTLLAAATSSGLDATFFSAKVSNLVSKYFGESSKLIGVLFAKARELSPSVVFLDEFEALSPRRDGAESGAERRILSTLLAELDGMAEKCSDDYVLTIGATNTPWYIDDAVLSRFEKKIHIPLPDNAARERILQIHSEGAGCACTASYQSLAERTRGFSGRQIERMCKEVAGNMVQEMNPDIADRVDAGLDAIKKYSLRLRPLTEEDFCTVLQDMRPETPPEVLAKFAEWSDKVG